MSFNPTPSTILQQLAELERQHGGEHPGLERLASDLHRRLSAMPTSGIFAVIRKSADLAEDVGYWCCIGVLRERGDQETFDTCAAWTRDGSPERRQSAADILAQLGFRDGAPFQAHSWSLIEALLCDEDDDVVASALAACGELQLGEPAVLAAFASHASANVRFGVVRALSGRGDQISIRTLIQLSHDHDRDIRNWACFGLAQLTAVDTPEIRDALFGRMSESDSELGPEIRGEALIGLARRVDVRVLEPLKQELAGEFHGAWSIEAAQALKDPSLGPIQIALKDRLEPDDLSAFGDELDQAIAACSRARV